MEATRGSTGICDDGAMDDRESDYASFFAVLKEIGYRGGLNAHASTTSFATDAPRAIALLRTHAAALRHR